MGRVYIWCELVCTNCAASTAGRHTSADRVPRKEMKKEAAKEGWIFEDQDAVCRKCKGETP